MKIKVPFKYVAEAKLDSGNSIKVIIRDSFSIEIQQVGNTDSPVKPFVTVNSLQQSREFFKGDGKLYEAVKQGASKSNWETFKTTVETNDHTSPFYFLTKLNDAERLQPIFNSPAQAKAVYKNIKRVDRRVQVDTIKAIAARFLLRGNDVLKEVVCIDLVFDSNIDQPTVKIETSDVAGRGSVFRQPIESYLENKETIVKAYKENLIDMQTVQNLFEKLKETIKFYSSTNASVNEASLFDLIASYQKEY